MFERVVRRLYESVRIPYERRDVKIRNFTE